MVWDGDTVYIYIEEKPGTLGAYNAGTHGNGKYEILSDLDLLNSHHPHATLGHWLQQARDLGTTTALKDYYEMNARRLITTWGGNLNDYACRNWNGLMWDYYTKRWENYIRQVTVSVISGKEFDDASYRATTDKFQEKWVTSTEDPITGTTDQDVLTHCRELREKYRTQLDNWANGVKH